MERDKSDFQALPTELLVNIFTHLSSARDKVNLRYVSRRIRSAIEVPSLWSEFVWPYYDNREENCVKSLLKSCGGYIKTLAFPNNVPPLSVLQYCENVIELAVPTARFVPQRLGEFIQEHMRVLQKIDFKWNTDFMLMPFLELITSSKLKELTIRLTMKPDYEIPSCFSRGHNLQSSMSSFIGGWVNKGFMPCNLNIVCIHVLPTDLHIMWSYHNVVSSSGQTGQVKLYSSLKVPLDLYIALPLFQIQFGQTAPFSFVDANKFGLVGLEKNVICLSSRNTAAVKAAFSSYSGGIPIDDNLSFVTDFDISRCESLHSDHLEQLAVICPKLHRLSLAKNLNCLKKLQGLRAIASCCNNLQGLNLLGIQVSEVENHIQLLEILSNIKLTHLAIDLCNIVPFQNDDEYKQMLPRLYQKFLFLQALHLEPSECSGIRMCPNCNGISDQDLLLLSCFPLLTYCRLDQMSYSLAALQNVATSCKRLSCFYYSSPGLSKPLSFSTDLSVQSLQQLFIGSVNCDVPDTFMDAVSIHGKLVHVLMEVKSVGYEGIASLITNSPKLVTFHIIADRLFSGSSTLHIYDATTLLMNKFCNRHLFHSGSFEIDRIRRSSRNLLLELDIDVMSYLWI